MKPLWKTIILWLLPLFVVCFFIWQGFFISSNDSIDSNLPSSKMTYGRFLEYLEMGWVKKVDLYNNGHTAIVEAIGPELGKQVQKIRVDLPASDPGLISQLKKAKIDLDAHSQEENNVILEIFDNLFLPLLLIIGFVLLFQYFMNNAGNAGSAMSFGKTRNQVQVELNTGVLFDDVAGIEEAKEEFKEIVRFLKRPESFTTVGAHIPKGVLLLGPPGTGKTLLAKAIAGESGVPFFNMSGSEFVEMFVGVGASRVRDLFKKAKNNVPCIIFIDEIDAVGRQRGTGIGGGNDEREQTLNQLLTEMDGFERNTGIIVIAATNRADILDSALLRPGRFDRQVTLNVPDFKARLAILSVHSRNKKLSPEVSLEIVARRTAGFSGADLANLLNEASILTARRRKKMISMHEIDLTIDRVVSGMEGTPLIDSKSKRLIAYHEIGHAIVGTLLEHHDPVQKVTLIPRGQARGLTWFIPAEEQSLISRAQILARIMSALGGRAAEEVVFGGTEVTTGAGNDLQQLTYLARQMVTRFGMSNMIPFSLESERGNPFLGRNMGLKTEYSDNIATNIDAQIQYIIQSCHEKTIQIIKDNRVIIDCLVDILIDKETMTGDEFREIVAEYTTLPPKSHYNFKT
uniref:cell division protein n=1 Tax=Glaucosphaera vacuolata TaxID=38265 RepID=UPI001FCD1F0F|nr:cell division protein [Glaucosphaera vacuolata]UNJ18583.1 cell division protein [Glaucosphaera vacuolata]